MRAAYQRLVLAWVVMAVTACALLPQPQTVEEAVFATAATIRTLRETTAERLEAGVITGEEALKISASLDEARKYVDTAVIALELQRPTDAQTAIELAIAILDRIEANER